MTKAKEDKGKERILCIDDNREALLWRLRVIEAAKQEIIFATFDLVDDHSGREIMAALLSAAQRGVRVRILLDGFNERLHCRKNACFRALVQADPVEARCYNPFLLRKIWKAGYRMHDKYLIADSSVYILGGRNTNDLFLGSYRKRYNIDRDILVYESRDSEDNSLRQVKRYFESVWSAAKEIRFRHEADAQYILEEHYGAVREKYPEAFAEVNWEAETWEAERVELLTNPIKAGHKKPEVWDAVFRVMETGNRIQICTPYIICDRKMYRDLSALCQGGRQVQVMLNAVENGANPWGCVDYLNQKKKIREKGMEVFEFLGGQSLHTKTIVVDDEISIVGSFNFDIRSTYLDTEMMLLIRSKELNAGLRAKTAEQAEACKRILPDGSEIRGEHYQKKEMSVKKRIIYSLLRVIIIPFRHLL